MLLILARQAIGDGIKSGRDLGAVYPMLKAIETTEDYARYLEVTEKAKPLHSLEEGSRSLPPEERPLQPTRSLHAHAQKIQLPLRGNTNAVDNTAPMGPESV